MGRSHFRFSATVAVTEREIVQALLARDESAFTALVNRYGPSMNRVAALYVRSETLAEEVVQETWIRILRALPTFQQRSSLRTWIFVVLKNCAVEYARREGRTVPVSQLSWEDLEPPVAPEHFFPADHRRWAGAWTTVVRRWDTLPEERLLSAETLAVVRAAADRLPPLQRAVVTLRDIEGWPPEEVCSLLGITDGNQRVLLYRARATVRQALERHLSEEAC
jgi:RNA polymerase sigma-70 factor (ECF subfamily)